MRRAALGTLLALALSACEPERVEETAVERFQFEARSERPRIEVEIEEGAVEVEGVEGSQTIEAEFVKKARSVDRKSAAGLLPLIDVQASEIEEGVRFHFSGRVESIPPFAGSLEADLRLRVPREIDIEIAAEDGRIRIERVHGVVRAEVDDGRISVERVSGELRLRAGDGSISGRDLDGDVEASADDGDIDLIGVFGRLHAATDDGDVRIDAREWRSSNLGWEVRSFDGAIEILLPAGAAADVDATVSDGRIVNRLSSFEGKPREENESRLSGKLGGGGPLLVFSAMDGRIELGQK